MELHELLTWPLALLPGGLWMAFWLWAVDWRKLWPLLAAGAWIPCVLLALLAALTWSRLDPHSGRVLGLITLPAVGWHLTCVGGLFGAALFSGWLQGQIGYLPDEISFEPVAAPHHGSAH